MDPDRLPRKLAAILYADVADYSRLTGEDEDATHRRLRQYLDFISGIVERQHGKVMHYAGDAVLAMFEAVVDALSCASTIQSDLKERNADLAEERKLQFRIGVNLGDVIEDRGDIYGDGVNIAARLESLAEPGGICVSESVYDAISSSLPFSYAFMGEQQVKNIEKPVRVYRVMANEDPNGNAASQPMPAGHDEQEIRFCTSSDGVGIAYASVGEGSPLVKTANWLNHLEFDWQSPISRHVFAELSRAHQLVRYDERGNGLSDWEVDDISFDRRTHPAGLGAGQSRLPTDVHFTDDTRRHDQADAVVQRAAANHHIARDCSPAATRHGRDRCHVAAGASLHADARAARPRGRGRRLRWWPQNGQHDPRRTLRVAGKRQSSVIGDRTRVAAFSCRGQKLPGLETRQASVPGFFVGFQ